MYHQPDGKKAAIEEEESMGQLKTYVMEIEMEVDAESAEMKSPKRKVVCGESEETQDYVCEMLTISRKKQRSLPLCRVLSASGQILAVCVDGG